MIIYNVTIKVDITIAANWLAWMRDVHIPAMIETGCFEKATILHLLEIDDSEGPTYAIQYVAKDMDIYHQYINKYADQMRNDSFKMWGDKFIAFRSVMRVVN